MSVGLIITGSFIAVALFAIGSAIKDIAEAIKELAHEVHVHAEVMNEIKHQGIGCDNNAV